jgi:beta-glucosidase
MQNRTYRYFHGDPLYGFGYGLSYSTFAFSNIHLSSTRIQAGKNLTVEADVKNTSRIAGDEVAELYLEYGKTAGAPLRALKGFKRLHLAAGQTRRVSFTLDPRELSMATETGERMVMAGSYTVFVGGNQPGKGANGVSTQFQINGQHKLPQ